MIFVSAPYSSKEKEVVESRIKAVSIYSGNLLKEGRSNISPLTLGTTILQHCDLPSDFEFWNKLSYDLLELCEEIHVLKLDGWRESIGVMGEIDFATKKNKKIKYINI